MAGAVLVSCGDWAIRMERGASVSQVQVSSAAVSSRQHCRAGKD
jgi:hypothetical protein